MLAVIVDGRWLDVPPDALPRGPDTMDYLQPGPLPGRHAPGRALGLPRRRLRPPGQRAGRNRAVRVAATVDAAALGSDRAVTVTAELLTSAGAKRAEATAGVRLDGPGRAR